MNKEMLSKQDLIYPIIGLAINHTSTDFPLEKG